MRSRTFATVALASLVLVASLGFNRSAQAQTNRPVQQTQTVTNVIATYLPVTLWTITGAVLGAVAWPGIAAGTLAITPVTTTAAFVNPGAVVGAVIGGSGYLATR